MSYKVAVITSRFNEPVTTKLTQGAREQSRLKQGEAEFDFFEVPGAYELPLAAKWSLEKGYDAVVTLGAVIRGETTHYESVCNSVERGCTDLQLQTGCPVVMGVLTTENAEQAYDRCGGKKGHKGAEAIDVVLEMLALKKRLVNN